PAPQASGAVQAAPHGPMVPPQPSPAIPQLKPLLAQVAGVHEGGAAPSTVVGTPHLFGPPAPQTCPVGHVPHGPMVPPQPSPADPQSYPRSVHDLRTQVGPPSGPIVGSPHWLNPPTPQTKPPVQAPQSIVFPQPSALVPQVYPADAQVRAEVHVE